MTDAAFIGTAGWSIPARYADEFPPTGTHLERYATRLDAVEINSSFYRPHRRATYARWAGAVPSVFRFSVKLPKAITHGHRLQRCGDLLDRFADEVGGLGDKLGVILMQLPPSLGFEHDGISHFMAELRAHFSVPVACEPRHASWFTPAAEACLAEHRIARVAADPAPAPGASDPGGWPGFAYLRLHGTPRMYHSDYDAAALAGIADRLVAIATKEVPAWCIFDNTAAFHALGSALGLQAQLPLRRRIPARDGPPFRP